jgi:hypothetical protein
MVSRFLKIATSIALAVVLVWGFIASAGTMRGTLAPRPRVTIEGHEFEVAPDGQLHIPPPSLWSPWGDQTAAEETVTSCAAGPGPAGLRCRENHKEP